ncbi:MAG: DUF5916 domain-containing protein [Gemmatimonadales bacterium]
MRSRSFSRSSAARPSAWTSAGTALAMLFAAPSLAQEQATRPALRAVRVEVAPVIDGRLDERSWQAAQPAAGFVQNAPLAGNPASEQTEVRIVYDDAALYVGAWLLDSDPGGIIAGEARRDASPNETDAFQILLDTFLDGQNGFVFGTTPTGIEFDGQLSQEGTGGGGFNLNWDGSWTVATSRDSEGWYAEFRIPFSTLRYGSGQVQTWGINFSRRIRRRSEQSYWSPVPRQFDLARVSLAGRLHDLEVPFRHTAAVIPYVLSSGKRDYRLAADTELNAEVGGDAKIALGPSLSLDLTVNTDFAQVEADDQAINLTRFDLFFPEKRPFFLENAGIFAVGTSQASELFFSRRIGIERGREAPILAGTRLTGRVGETIVGVMNVQTRGLDLDDPVTGQPTRWSPANNFSVARLIRELPNRSRVGAIFVSRLNTDDGGDYNLTYGLDGRLGLGTAWTIDGYAAQTNTPGLDGGQYAVSSNVAYNTDNWNGSVSYREVAEGFNPEVGFLPRSEYRFLSASIMRRVRFPTTPWFYEWRPHVSYREHFALDGFSESRFIHIDSHFQFANGAFFQLPAINLVREGLREPFEISPGVIVPPGTYDNFEWGFAYNSNLSAPLRIEGRLDIGGFYNGIRKGGSATVSGQLSDALVSSVRVQYHDVDLDTGRFQTALAALRVAYSFTPRIYLQSLIQYSDRTRNLSSNIRFGWLTTAGTGLFIVYNDLEHVGPLSRTGIDGGPLERALIVKFTRQFMLGT